MKRGFKGPNRLRCSKHVAIGGTRMKRQRIRITIEEGPQAGKSIKAKDWICPRCSK